MTTISGNFSDVAGNFVRFFVAHESFASDFLPSLISWVGWVGLAHEI
jgi:hypothetical protein